MATEVGFALIEKLVSILPRFILKRVYTEAKLKDAISIETRALNPIFFSLGSYIPGLNACFTITNFTDLVWKLHDFSAEIWIGQPLATAVCYDKPDIMRRKKTDVYTRCFLNEKQVSRLQEEKNKGNVRATIYVWAYLESKIGLMKFSRTVECTQVTIQ